ncbi:penicillin-binding protein [Paenibacillus sp. GSMTC-2017]|uniref:penicillin-binding protein n=1 Tax=Paenibacillus sp. GSMTC-2017 TaxID=2794350 RepID=UPI0018D773C2|nr:penicillin-binding protein [Paenibacillus sp. GSMTC-2017]MBH5316907.1 penicillin-binding protein [Paenibacillus sp. GSMTC-2017]
MSKRIRLRTLLFGGVMTLLFLVLIGRTYYVQIVDGDKYYQLAAKRWSTAETLTGKRGSITDRDGNILAMDTIAYNVSVNPQIIHDAAIVEEVIDGLNAILDVPKDELRKIVTAKNDKGKFYIHRELRNGGWQIDKPLADKLTTFSDELEKKLLSNKKVVDSGIYLSPTLKRFYPSKTLASQVVGYVSKNGKHMTGIEGAFNDELKGEDGYIVYQKDGKRVQLSKGDVEYKEEVNGKDVALTIDSDIQRYVEEALRDVVSKYAPKSATAIAADPNTMEILAMANMPEFDPNEYWKSDYANSYNHAVGSLYEPGSTFKIATLAAAVEEGVFDPEEFYKSGSYKVPGDPRVIRDHNRVGWGTIKFIEGLKRSSNVAFVKMGYEGLGADKLRDYYSRFGFGQKTGIELGNEATGTIQFHYNRDIAAATFGQGGVAVTPIQQVAAVAAVANGGKLLVPHIVKSKTDPETKETTLTEPKVVRQVISEETSRLVGGYLEQVVSDQDQGTGKNAYIEGYRIAGKTGTAQKVVNGKYSTTKFMVSFIGYAPVENPKIVLYVAVDEPNNSLVGGGTVAAPAFREIMLKSLRKMGIAPSKEFEVDVKSEEVHVSIPQLKDLKIAQAKAELKAKSVTFEIVGNGGTVLQQIPAAGSVIHPTQRVYLITEQRDKLPVPDLTGVSLRDALELTSLVGAKLITEGTGYVVSQKVEEVDKKRIVRVKLSPPIGSEQYVELPVESTAQDESAGTEAESSGETEGADDAANDEAVEGNTSESNNEIDTGISHSGEN